MPKRHLRLSPRIKSFSIKPKVVNALLLYALVVFLIRFADAIMAYVTPIYLESHLHSAWLMGIIISLSSAVGLVCDLIFGEIFPHRRYRFFLFWGIIFAIIFPATFFFLPSSIPVIILTMAVWGTYFEMLRFSDYNFINHFLNHQYHAVAWGILSIFVSAAYLTAPSIATLVLNFGPRLPYLTALLTLTVAFFGYLLISFRYRHQTSKPSLPNPRPKHLFHQLGLWRVLIPVLWPVLLFLFTLNILEAVIWTSGAILSQEFSQLGLPGGILFFAYLSPALVMGSLAGKISQPYGKKKAAFSSGLMAGVFYTIAGLAHTPVAFLVAIFLGSLFTATAWPEISGTVEDYVSRLGHSANSMIGLGNSMASLAFIIGPILAGFFATFFSHQTNFTLVGIVLVIVSLICLTHTPRKIRLPQQIIHRLEDFLVERNLN